ncbi:MAG: hypothetical protein NT027_19970 [Proteobacteria bacterium]|nr:hypothetical protein [Pseudomonadota bacterium]
MSFRMIVLATSLLLFFKCAAKLPKEVTNNRPIGEELPLDSGAIEFALIQSDDKINLKQYMDQNNLSHLLLTFGSENCDACREKAAYLEANLVGNYGLVEGNSGNNFEVVGVNVDVAEKRKSVVSFVQNSKLTHIAWSDPSGQLMTKYFQPAGLDRKVPLSVMINKRGIVWRVTAEERVSAKDLVQKVALTLGQEVVELPPVPPTPPKPPIQLSYLAEEKPDRLQGAPVTACRSEESAVKNAHEYFGRNPATTLKFILVDQANCAEGSICAENQKVIQSFLPTCTMKNCALLTMANNVEASTCDRGVMKGGAEVFSTFEDHFTWDKVAVNAEGQSSFKSNIGPIVLAFDDSGMLVFSHSGPLSKSVLDSRWESDFFRGRAIGPAFVMPNKNGSTTFSSWRSASKYSVVIFWDAYCAGCLSEISEWHKKDALMDFCDQNSKLCQVTSINKDYGDGGDQNSVRNFISTLENDEPGSINLGWRISLSVDAAPADDEGRARRWFEGWYSAKYKSNINAVLVYDREGKVRGVWNSGTDPNEPLHLIKKLESIP